MTLYMIFVIAALIAFLCATFGVKTNINLVALGLALLTVAALVGGGGSLGLG